MRRLWASVGALSVLVSCASGPTVPSVEPVREFVLAAGDGAMVSGTGLTVRFERVTNDSRCPADVVCIVAGNAVVAVTVAREGRPAEALSLRTEAAQSRAELGDWALSLTKVEPYPSTDRTIAPGDYQATFRVDPLAEPARP
jgi:hypothetical protein